MNEQGKPNSFEEAMEELENIVHMLESGNVNFDNALELFEKGINLINFCQKKIVWAEQKISKLIEKNEEIFLESYSNEEIK